VEREGKGESQGEKKACAVFMNSGTDEEKEISRVRYKAAKKIAKKAIAVAKSIAYNSLYQKLETKKGEKEVFKLARARERRTRDLGVVRCIKDEDSKMLSEDVEIKERWQRYFSKLLNKEVTEAFRSKEAERSERHLDPHSCEPFSKAEIRDTLRMMVNGKVEGPNQISVEVWKCSGEEGLEWLT